MLPLLLLSLTSAAPSPLELERAVRDRFERAGRSAPPVDQSLSRAATELARHALHHGVEDAASLLRVTAALSRHAAWDPNPTVVLLRASNDVLLDELKKQQLAAEPATHVGLGLSLGDERGALVVLLAQRKAELAAFKRAHPKPTGPQRLCATLAEPLDAAELFVTRPSGTVERTPMAGADATKCAQVAFPSTGRHAVEVLGKGPRGPEVAALFFVDVGAVKASLEDALPEPDGPKAARAALWTRINALRLQLGVQPVAQDEGLERVAQAWAQALADGGFFAHVAPDGSTLKDRLLTAGYPFSAAGENLGLSSGPLAAHFGIEHSPGHRNNLLDPAHQRLGLGIARRADGLTVLVEVLARPAAGAAEEADPLGAVYASIQAERRRRKLPPLKVNAVLEGLAQGHAREALALDVPKAELPNRPRLHERAFALLDTLKSVAVDVIVADAPRLGPESKNLGAAGNTDVGVGLVRGSSARYGEQRYWVVVIYGASGD